MFELVPAAVGVPESCPLEVLNVAHAGLFVMENVSALPSGSLAVGLNEYACPTLAVTAGLPLIVGARFVGVGVGVGVVGEPTVIEKGLSRAVETPSEAVMTMLE